MIHDSLDIDSITNLAKTMNEAAHKIKDSFPPGNEHILKNLAASMIHLTMFLEDLLQVNIGKKLESEAYKKSKEVFYNTCGCNIKSTPNCS
jgi:hypothetical protein